jgi:hypothetical protein
MILSAYAASVIVGEEELVCDIVNDWEKILIVQQEIIVEVSCL